MTKAQRKMKPFPSVCIECKKCFMVMTEIQPINFCPVCYPIVKAKGETYKVVNHTHLDCDGDVCFH